jgi:hypothetical protein
VSFTTLIGILALVYTIRAEAREMTGAIRSSPDMTAAALRRAAKTKGEE